MSANNFGGAGYTAPQQRALTSIAKTPNPDISSQEKLVDLLQQHSAQIKYLAANQKQLQQGVNAATMKPGQQLQQFVADIVVLLGGGQLAAGLLDFGDLQYILPALGALFGLGDEPFPIDLVQAAQKAFFGYVVPSQQFVDVINYIVGNWASVFGIDPQFIEDVQALITAIGELFGGIHNLLPSLNGLFDALGLDGRDLGPLGTALKPIIKLFSGIDLANFGNAIEFITDAIDPFIVKLTAVINFINGVLAILDHDGDVVNSPLPEMLAPIKNLVGTIKAAFDKFGFIRQQVLPPIHIGRLTNSLPSLEFDSDFDLDPDGDDTAGAWYHDATVGHSALGSAAIAADGGYHDLPTEPVAVAEKQRYRPSMWVAWESASGAAGSVQLQVREFLDGTLINTVVLATATPSETADFNEVFGTYTVPSGVDAVALAVAVTAGFTAGTVWVDDLTGEPVGLLQMAWVDNLVERWQNVAGVFGIEDVDLDGDIDLDDLWGNVPVIAKILGAFDGIDLDGGSGAVRDEIGSAVQSLRDKLTGIVEATPTDLDDWLLGLLGLVPFGSASSALPQIGSGQLGQAVQNLLINPLFDGFGSFVPGAGISWDALAAPGALGSALVNIIPGVAQSMLGNEVDVDLNDTIDLGIRTRWNDLTGTGPISLLLHGYNAAGDLIDTQVIDSVPMPGLNSGGAWVQLAGSYLVSNPLVRTITSVLTTSPTLTGGQVRFSFGTITKPNLVHPGDIRGPLAGSGTLIEDFQNTLDTMVGSAHSALSDLETRFANILDIGSTLNGDNIGVGNILTDRIGDLQDNFNNLVQQILGWDPPDTGTWYSPTHAGTALGSQANTILGHGGTLAQHELNISTLLSRVTNALNRINTLETAGGGSPGGGTSDVSILDDFERTGSLGPGWSNSNANYQCDGHNAYFSLVTTTNTVATCVKAGPGDVSSGDYQYVEQTIGNFAPTYQGGFYGWNRLLGRVGGAYRMVFAIRSDGYWEVYSGAALIGSGTIGQLSPGARVGFYCGDRPNSLPRRFIPTVNNNVIATIDYAGASVGSGFRGWGMEAEANGNGALGVFKQVGWPGKVNQWSGVDVV